jgi:hypothetical protein
MALLRFPFSFFILCFIYKLRPILNYIFNKRHHTQLSARNQPFLIYLLVTSLIYYYCLNMRRESPNRFSKVFKSSHNTIKYIVIYLFYYFMIYIYIYIPTNFRSYSACPQPQPSPPSMARGPHSRPLPFSLLASSCAAVAPCARALPAVPTSLPRLAAPDPDRPPRLPSNIKLSTPSSSSSPHSLSSH